MQFFILAKKIRAPRYPIAISLMINSSSFVSFLNFSFGNSFYKELILEDTDIPATTLVRLLNLCVNSSESLANRYEIDK